MCAAAPVYYPAFCLVCFPFPRFLWLITTGRAIINVCANAWVARGRGLSDDDTFKLILAGLKTIMRDD